ncbi:LOB domain-containing protein 41-like [Magnolia sinica]|uniref:LOB domain-containing protein 41-like n=1 Tax=Magnolia sinica TaxID=86752 RepID=UPI002657D680|nr:LOB domain-containing protein 41-like [Magnolia sinica]
MRMSCNGCRVLRKGCSENCSIRPCLQWIKNPESQANATVFLAKFYGRAGLMNLINAGPEHLRPAIFRSLLYEACGRIVNPIYGSVGLLWSGSWQLCQAAVEAVLKGAPIMPIPSETAASPSPPMKAYDIRHVSKEETSATQDLHKVKTRSRFKRSAKPKPKVDLVSDAADDENPDSTPVCNLRWRRCYPDDMDRVGCHDSSSSQHSEPNADGDSRETESMFSVETVEASLVSRAEQEPVGLQDSRADDGDVELELTLGFEPVSHVSRTHAARHVTMHGEMDGCGADTCKVELGLDLPA